MTELACVDQRCVYDFDCAGTLYHIVRLPCGSSRHTEELEQWCVTNLGHQDLSTWILGIVRACVYQEFWFVDSHIALQFFLTWSNHERTIQ